MAKNTGGKKAAEALQHLVEQFECAGFMQGEPTR
jgi:hypothetical protein